MPSRFRIWGNRECRFLTFPLGAAVSRGLLCAGGLEASEEVTDILRQSKLSPQQLEELQRSTHFDKKELQQWYKGQS